MKTFVELLKVLVSHAYLYTVEFHSFVTSFFQLSPPFLTSTGDTLLAIRAPIGTQLEVPIPEAVSNMGSLCILCPIRSGYCFVCVLT